MKDPPLGVATFSAQIIFLPAILAKTSIELHPGIDEPLDRRRRLFHDGAHHVFVTEPRAGIEGVIDMLGKGVFRAPDARNPALGPGGIGIIRLSLGDDGHLSVLGGMQCKSQPGDPRTDDNEIKAAHEGRSRMQTLSISRVAPKKTARATSSCPWIRSNGDKRSGSTSAM